MHFYVYEESGYAFLQAQPLDAEGWLPVLVFPAPTGQAAIDTINTRVAVRQGAEFYAPPPTTVTRSDYIDGDWQDVEETQEHPGAFRCAKCHAPIKPSRLDFKHHRVWWPLACLCVVAHAAA